MDMPPQVLKQQVRSLAASQDLHSLRDSTALQAFGNRLPVLQAFQEFLEIERRKARRRLAATAFGFLAVLLFILTAGGTFFFRFAGRVDSDVRKLEQALASARDETGALRGDTQAMQRALDDARVALAALQEQLAALPASAPALDLAAVAGTLDFLQAVQSLRAEQEPLLARLAAVEREADAVATQHAEFLTLAATWRDAAQQWTTAFDEWKTSLQSAQARLEAVRAPPAPAAGEPDASRGLFRRKREAPPPPVTAPDPRQVLAVMEELNRVRDTQPALWAQYFKLAQEAEQRARVDASLQRQRAAMHAAKEEAAQALEKWQARHAELQGRLAALRESRSAS
jgi:DNA repair exonuclease SbcCD ATPase subunit